MLQQTQVRTVIPYFQRFMTRFPTVGHLASADISEVLRLWEGLGYYRRARNLHRAARDTVSDHEGIFPSDPAKASRLPGIGRYTLGAILSQAFDLPFPILEANSERVLCRLFARKGDPKSGTERRWLWQAAQHMLPRKNVGEFNQAMMELGALVCTSGKPACLLCPVASACQARRLGIETLLPRPARRRPTKRISEIAAVVRRKDKVLLVQRSAEGRWAELWEFPHTEVRDGEEAEDAVRRVVRELTGLESVPGGPLVTVSHSVTHHRIKLECYEARFKAGTFRSSFYTRGRWLRPEQLAQFPVSSPQRKIAEFLIRPDGRRSLS